MQRSRSETDSASCCSAPKSEARAPSRTTWPKNSSEQSSTSTSCTRGARKTTRLRSQKSPSIWQTKRKNGRCKKNSKRKRNKGKKDEPENPNQALEWKYLPKELLIKMVVERTSHEDCNAGVIFDNLTSPFWRDEKTIVDAVCDALSEENVHLIAITLPKDDDGLEFCDNYRYKMRKQADDKPAEKEALDKTFVDKDTTQNKQKKAKANKGPTEADKKLEDKKKAEEEKQKLEQARQEELRKRLDEPEPKILDDADKEAYLQRYNQMVELYTEINLRTINQKHEASVDHTQDEQKADTQNDQNKDIKQIEEHENDNQEAKDESVAKEAPFFGSRIFNEVPMQYSFRYLCELVKQNVPDPVWPDPDKEPLPPPVIQQIVKKPANRPDKPKVTLFSIWTPVDKLTQNEDEEPQEQEAVDPKAKDAKGQKKNNPKAKEEPPQAEPKEEKGPALDKSITRWILQPNESKTLHLKFFSTKIGRFTQTLGFEVLGSSKQFPLDIKAI